MFDEFMMSLDFKFKRLYPRDTPSSVDEYYEQWQFYWNDKIRNVFKIYKFKQDCRFGHESLLTKFQG